MQALAGWIPAASTLTKSSIQHPMTTLPDWQFRKLHEQALSFQTESKRSYAAVREVLLSGYHGIPSNWHTSLNMIAEDAAREALKARAGLFMVTGDGTPWTDPTGKLTLWEGAL